MKRYFFRWFVPVILLFAMIGAAMLYYRGSVRKYAFDLEISKAYGEIERGLGESELIVKTITDGNYGVAVSLPLIDFEDDDGIIVTLLSNLKKIDKVTHAMAVDENGRGYDNDGKSVDISGEIMFKEISDRFSDGGTGYLLVRDEAYTQGSVAAVNSVNFKNKKKGYLITIIHNDDLRNQVFGGVSTVFRCYYITLEGFIISQNHGEDFEGFAEEIWPKVPDNLSPEMVKLCIVQKNSLITDIDNYGCLLVVPSSVTYGAVIALASNEELDFLIQGQMKEYYIFCLQIVAAVIIYVILCILLLLAIRFFRRRRLVAFDEKSRRDPLTGFYSKDGLIFEIDKYIRSSPIKAGILFVVRVENFTRIRAEKGDTEADKKIAAFTDRFTMEFRVTDVVGRVGDDEFYAFLKDIRDEKDIRKQIDEMRLLLHDIREEHAKEGEALTAYAGFARYPGNGLNAGELMDYSKVMLVRSRESGNSISYITK